MNGRWKLWWNERSPRERKLLTVMFGLLVISVVWLTYRTIGISVNEARERYQSALVEHGRVKERLQLLKASEERHPAPLDMPITMFVNQSAAATGFVVTDDGAETPHGRADITIASARPLALFQWVSTLEAQGIVPETFAAQANADRTLSVKARFRGRTQ